MSTDILYPCPRTPNTSTAAPFPDSAGTSRLPVALKNHVCPSGACARAASHLSAQWQLPPHGAERAQLRAAQREQRPVDGAEQRPAAHAARKVEQVDARAARAAQQVVAGRAVGADDAVWAGKRKPAQGKLSFRNLFSVSVTQSVSGDSVAHCAYGISARRRLRNRRHTCSSAPRSTAAPSSLS